MRSAEGGSIAENISSSLLPGGSLISAALNRQVMIWSDRGGASRHIGDRWAARSWFALERVTSGEWPVPYGESYRLLRAIRLDDVPEVSREANLHQVENPDFLLVGQRSGEHGAAIVQAADAKFAADRIKPSQVSVDVLGRLLEVVGSARSLLDSTLESLQLASPTLVRGVFICPESALTDFLIAKTVHSRDPRPDPHEIVRAAPEPESLFVGLPVSRLIGKLARIDALPVTPRTNVISAVYYFRLACACSFLWSEGHAPLLSSPTVVDPEPGIVAAELSQRSEVAASAWELVQHWADDVQPQVQAREAIANVATLPIRMRDLRSEIEKAGRGDEAGFVRQVRKELELQFRSSLLEVTGEVTADDPRPLPRILDDVAKASRALRPELHARLVELVHEAPTASSVSPTAQG